MQNVVSTPVSKPDAVANLQSKLNELKKEAVTQPIVKLKRRALVEDRLGLTASGTGCSDVSTVKLSADDTAVRFILNDYHFTQNNVKVTRKCKVSLSFPVPKGHRLVISQRKSNATALLKENTSAKTKLYGKIGSVTLDAIEMSVQAETQSDILPMKTGSTEVFKSNACNPDNNYTIPMEMSFDAEMNGTNSEKSFFAGSVDGPQKLVVMEAAYIEYDYFYESC